MKKIILAIIFIFLATVALAGPPAIPPSVSSISAYTDITALWASGSCSGVLNDDGTCKAIGTDMPGIYDTPTAGQLTKWKNDGGVWKLESAGAPIDLSSSITQNVETTGYMAGRARGIIVAVPSGTHDGGDDASLMTDAGIDLGADTLIGMTVYNVTDGSSCTITDNAATTITCTLAGGTGNDWDDGDVWQVGPGPAQSGSIFYVGSAGTVRHPATVGYVAGYYVTAAASLIVNPASDSMVITHATASAIDAGDAIDSPATAGSFIWLHNASATVAYTHGKNGTWTDGGEN